MGAEGGRIGLLTQPDWSASLHQHRLSLIDFSGQCRRKGLLEHTFNMHSRPIRKAQPIGRAYAAWTSFPYISKSTKMCQSMTDFHRVCNVPTVDYSIPEALESPSSPAIYCHSTTKQLLLHILVVNYNTNITQHILIDTIHFW